MTHDLFTKMTIHSNPTIEESSHILRYVVNDSFYSVHPHVPVTLSTVCHGMSHGAGSFLPVDPADAESWYRVGAALGEGGECSKSS